MDLALKSRKQSKSSLKKLRQAKTAQKPSGRGSPAARAGKSATLVDIMSSYGGALLHQSEKADHVAETKLTVVITHHNYSHVVGTAIDSVLVQTHKNIELLIIDDASDQRHYRQLAEIVAAADDRRIQLIRLTENVGQTAAMLMALDKCASDFIAYLDPDDYYEPNFAEAMLRAHLNPRKPASVAACEMGLYRIGGGKVALSQTEFLERALSYGRYDEVKWNLENFGYSQFYPAINTGWLWAATSSLMFRRDALEFLRHSGSSEPAMRRICGDGLLAYGAHMLGGTLFVHETLSWRGMHAGNAVLPMRFLGGGQQMQRQVWADAVAKDFYYTNVGKLLSFIVKTILSNGAAEYFQPSQLGEVISTHLNSKELSNLCAEDENVRALMWKYGSNTRT
jgi:glycosyltransferase involved in cell wall biosynthesis